MPQPSPAVVDAMVKEALRESEPISNLKSFSIWINRIELAVITFIIFVNIALGFYAIISN